MANRTNYQLIIIVVVPFLLSCVAIYLAWFRADIFRAYLRWNSQVFGQTKLGQAWMASKYYFWLMRAVVTCLFILSMIVMLLALRELF